MSFLLLNDSAINPLGTRFAGFKFQTSYSDSNNTYTTDYGEFFNQAWDDQQTAWQQHQADQNAFSWTQQLLVPGLQAAANILLLEWQKDQYDEQADEAQEIIEQTLQDYCDCITANLPDFEEFYPSQPEVAEYVPPELCHEQMDAICCNINSVLKSEELTKLIDMVHMDQQVKRMERFDAKFACKLSEYNEGIKRLLQGNIEQETLLEVTTDEAEQAAMYGRQGNLCRGSRVSMGLTKMRMEELGRDRWERSVALWNQISPVEKLNNMNSMMVTPQQRLAWQITITQLVQNSLQNKYNVEASGNPAKMAELQVKLQKCLQTLLVAQGKANAVNQFVPNYAGILQPQINALTNGIGSGIGAINWGNPSTNSTVTSPSVPSNPYYGGKDGGSMYLPPSIAGMYANGAGTY